jgi:hypothetical protein
MRDFAQETLLPAGWTNGNDPAAPQRKLISRRTASDPARSQQFSFCQGVRQNRLYHAGNDDFLAFPTKADPGPNDRPP